MVSWNRALSPKVSVEKHGHSGKTEQQHRNGFAEEEFAVRVGCPWEVNWANSAVPVTVDGIGLGASIQAWAGEPCLFTATRQRKDGEPQWLVGWH